MHLQRPIESIMISASFGLWYGYESSFEYRLRTAIAPRDLLALLRQLLHLCYTVLCKVGERTVLQKLT